MKYLNMIWAAILAAVFRFFDYILVLLDRVPGFPNFRSVEYALAGFEKVEARLAAAKQVAVDRADRFSNLADFYDKLADSADAEADRAACVQLRLSRLLD